MTSKLLSTLLLISFLLVLFAFVPQIVSAQNWDNQPPQPGQDGGEGAITEAEYRCLKGLVPAESGCRKSLRPSPSKQKKH